MNILFFLTPKSEVAYIRTDTTLQETLDIMEQYRYSVVPLIDTQGRYSGIITEGDLLYNIKNRFSYDMEAAEDVAIDTLDVRRTYEPIRISETIEEVFRKSMYQNFVPVVDDDNIFIGIVKRREIIQYFYNHYVRENKK
jgi:CBS domain-containing protein